MSSNHARAPRGQSSRDNRGEDSSEENESMRPNVLKLVQKYTPQAKQKKKRISGQPALQVGLTSTSAEVGQIQETKKRRTSPSKEVIAPEEVFIYENCCVCNGKIVDGYFGKWQLKGEAKGTCSRECEAEQEAKPKDWGEPKKKKKVMSWGTPPSITV